MYDGVGEHRKPNEPRFFGTADARRAFYSCRIDTRSMDGSAKWSGVMAAVCTLAAAVALVLPPEPTGSSHLMYGPQAVVADGVLGGAF